MGVVAEQFKTVVLRHYECAYAMAIDALSSAAASGTTAIPSEYAFNADAFNMHQQFTIASEAA
jgi:hypothetical protein